MVTVVGRHGMLFAYIKGLLYDDEYISMLCNLGSFQEYETVVCSHLYTCSPTLLLRRWIYGAGYYLILSITDIRRSESKRNNVRNHYKQTACAGYKLNK